MLPCQLLSCWRRKECGLKFDFQRTEEVVIILPTSPHLPYPILCKKSPNDEEFVIWKSKGRVSRKGVKLSCLFMSASDVE